MTDLRRDMLWLPQPPPYTFPLEIRTMDAIRRGWESESMH